MESTCINVSDIKESGDSLRAVLGEDIVLVYSAIWLDSIQYKLFTVNRHKKLQKFSGT